MKDFTIFKGDYVNSQKTEGDAKRALLPKRTKRQQWLFATWLCLACRKINRGGEVCPQCKGERPCPDWAEET